MEEITDQDLVEIQRMIAGRTFEEIDQLENFILKFALAEGYGQKTYIRIMRVFDQIRADKRLDKERTTAKEQGADKGERGES